MGDDEHVEWECAQDIEELQKEFLEDSSFGEWLYEKYISEKESYADAVHDRLKEEKYFEKK